ncbi:NfeD family protein [Halovivax gelatinilyticus]|uniref:NfeD family protein n=1 Tax=Halovivax gelatinilyticus TaxID=2961597 RepID=UPI0020CA76EF|nr:NfeD family protein [Halovivax gelatinilyticus]
MLELLVSNAALALLAAGLLLMAIEAMSPGAYFIVIGVAMAGAGLIGLLVPGGLGVLVLAGLTLLIGLAATWIYREFDFYGGKGRDQTSNSSSLAGATGYVTETVTPRGGEVKLDSGGFAPIYSARTTGGEIEAGSEVIVLDPGGGNVLTVEEMDAIEADEIDRALARDAEERERQPEEPTTESDEDRTDTDLETER